MRILQVTNMVSHHQLPLAREICKLIGEENFLFAAMGKPDHERIKNGWRNKYDESWIIHPNDSIEEYKKFNEFWDGASVVLTGERLIDRMQKRVDDEKLCFYMSERWFKPPLGRLRILHPRYFFMCLAFKKLSQSSFFHYLPTGPFAAADMNVVAAVQDRYWRWGYFTALPAIKRYFNNSIQEPISILWVGRMLKWKRVDLLIQALAQLKAEGRFFQLNLVGNGPERERLTELSNRLLGSEYYTVSDFIPSEDVPALMADHEVFVLPSNGYEGWGAVINEAMSVGCAVVASDKTGAGASLIEHGANGLLFQSDSVSSLYQCLKDLFDNRELAVRLGKNAMDNMEQVWGPESAAKRLVQLSSYLLYGKPLFSYSSGPLSKYN